MNYFYKSYDSSPTYGVFSYDLIKIIELFIDKDLTKQEIANMLGLKLDNIKYLMKKYDIRKKDFKKDIEVTVPDGLTEKSEPKT